MIVNRISTLFAEKKKNLLSIFTTAGYPRLDSTIAVVKALEKSGADLVEIGIPFSDPVADGPVIQESNSIALGNGITLQKILEQVRELRQSCKIPIVLMGYLNPVMQFGVERFCEEASQAGVDGIILPDLPFDEYDLVYRSLFEAHGLAMIFLISPTTSVERIQQIDHISRGFIYAVSASSTTGVKEDFSPEQIAYFERLSTMKLTNPLLIGFGISNHQTLSTACRYAAGAIVGSAFVSKIKDSADIDGDVTQFIQRIKSHE